MRNSIKLFTLFFSLAIFFVACDKSDDSGESDDPRGKIISSELLASYTPAEVEVALNDIDPALLAIFIPEYSIEIYKLDYETIDPKGNPTNASGAFAFPVGTDKTLSIASYQHGTVLRKDDIPSALNYESNVGIILSSCKGYAVSMPDYLGLGSSPGLHPYIHAKSEATASIDMLRAVKNFNSTENKVSLGEKLFLFGYSQGGHATMALHKELETNYSDEFTVTASSPMAGPHDLSGVQTDRLLDGTPYGAPYYVPYIMLAYNEAYDIYPSISDFIKSPYDVTVPALFDGLNGGGTINNAMETDIPTDILIDEVLEDFTNNSSNPFRVALEDNSLLNWTPSAPMHLCHCEGDELVVYENSVIAKDEFESRGATVTIVNPGNLGHGDCALPCLINGMNFLDTFQ